MSGVFEEVFKVAASGTGEVTRTPNAEHRTPNIERRTLKLATRPGGWFGAC
ncbi:MAG: hypothetical protein WCK89_04620 [bacterium]